MSDFKGARLVDLKMEHLELVLNWRNQQNIRNHMFNDEIITYEEHLNWFKRYSENRSSITKIYYLNGIPLGVLNISELNNTSKTCKWGFYIGASNTKKGTGKILGYISLDYIFYELNMNKLYGEVIEINKISLNFHEVLGFTKVKVLKDHIDRNNQRIDVKIMMLSKEQWEERKKIVHSQIRGSIT